MPSMLGLKKFDPFQPGEPVLFGHTNGRHHKEKSHISYEHPEIGHAYSISNSQGLLFDYTVHKNKAHLYLLSSSTLNLNLWDIGALFIPSGTWIDVTFCREKTVYALNQVNPILVYIWATDFPLSLSSAIPLPVKHQFVEQVGFSATGLNNFLVPLTDVSAYKSFSIQFPPQTNNLGITFQRSNDGINFDPFFVQHGNGAAGSSFFSPFNYILSGDIDFHFLQVQITSFTSGTVIALIDFSTLPSNQIFTNSAISDSLGNPLLGNQASSNIIGGTFTTTQTSGNIQNASAKGIIIYVNATAMGTGSITPVLLAHDFVSGNDGIIWQATTPITANGFYTYLLYPGLSGAPGATQVASVFLPHDFKLQTVANNANAATYFVNYGTEK